MFTLCASMICSNTDTGVWRRIFHLILSTKEDITPDTGVGWRTYFTWCWSRMEEIFHLILENERGYFTWSWSMKEDISPDTGVWRRIFYLILEYDGGYFTWSWRMKEDISPDTGVWRRLQWPCRNPQPRGTDLVQLDSASAYVYCIEQINILYSVQPSGLKFKYSL